MRTGIAPFAFAQRLENFVGEGVPDVVLHLRDGGECHFMELKHRPSAPVHASTPIFSGAYGLRPEQVAWIYSRAIAGAKVWILGQCDDWLVLVHGRHARDLAKMTSDDLVLIAEWHREARKTDWVTMLVAMK